MSLREMCDFICVISSRANESGSAEMAAMRRMTCAPAAVLLSVVMVTRAAGLDQRGNDAATRTQQETLERTTQPAQGNMLVVQVGAIHQCDTPVTHHITPSWSKKHSALTSSVNPHTILPKCPLTHSLIQQNLPTDHPDAQPCDLLIQHQPHTA